MIGDLKNGIAPWGPDECAVLSDEIARVLIDYHDRLCEYAKETIASSLTA